MKMFGAKWFNTHERDRLYHGSLAELNRRPPTKAERVFNVGWEMLTDRERVFVEHIERGLSLAETAIGMGTSKGTVNGIFQRVLTRTGCLTKQELIDGWRNFLSKTQSAKQTESTTVSHT